MTISRRFFLQSSGMLSAYLGFAPAQALASASSLLDASITVRRDKTLVVIFLRGGADGMNLVVPYGDRHYRSLRPTLGINAPGQGDGAAIDLDGYFGLHPALAPLMPYFQGGEAVAAHAVGYAHNTRSHFEEQDVWETGVIGNTINSDGWVNRHLMTSAGRGPIRALAIGESLPRLFHGDAATLTIRGLNDLKVGNGRDGLVGALEHAYAVNPNMHEDEAANQVRQSAAATFDAMRELRKVATSQDAETTTYPNTDLGRKLRDVARLIKADIGLEVAEVDLDGWDTHQNQGRRADGQFANLAGTLSTAVAAFLEDLKERRDDVLVATLTDFGRTAAENGTRGTDHGWANAMFLFGGAVHNAHRQRAGGAAPVIANWPGLAPDQLHEGRDLLHTMDFRDVLAEVVGTHLGNPNLAKVLPDHDCAPVGLVARS
ncbi:MAG: DUF1501 domain-containing protein [Planctomycetota bacterium]